MGTLRGDNGGERPQEGGGLPDLPPEWGTIIIPDDAAELDSEGTRVRRLFRREAFQRRWRRRLHLKPKPLGRVDDESPGLAVPLLIMTVAVIATLTSLFAVAWPGQHGPQRAAPQTTGSPPPISVAEIGMVDANGDHVPLREVAPAVILLVEGCTCETFITATLDAVKGSRPSASAGAPSAEQPPTRRVSVVVVDTGVPPGLPLSTQSVPLRGLADPNHTLRTTVPGLTAATGASGNSPAALLIDHAGNVVRAVPRVSSVADFQDQLPKLW